MSFATSRWDVVIVGGGPAGAAAAIQLAARDRGLATNTLLLDRAIFPRPKLCGGAVVQQADELLDFLDVHIDVPAVPIHAIRIDYPGGSTLQQQRNVFRIVRREEFDHALLQAARDRGVQIREGEQVRAIERERDCVRLLTTHSEYRARVVVGADGAKSLVRRALVGRDGGQVSVALEVLTPEEPASCAEFREHMAVFDFRPVVHGLRGYAWDFPSFRAGVPLMNRGIGAVSWGQGRPPLDLLAERLAEARVPFPADTVEGAAVHLYNPTTAQSADRAVLAGDAIGVDPLMGEGISAAIGTGMVAAHAVADAFADGDFAFADYRARIASSAIGWALRRNWLGAGYFYRLLRETGMAPLPAGGPHP